MFKCAPGLKCKSVGKCFDWGFKNGPDMECAKGGKLVYIYIPSSILLVIDGASWKYCAQKGDKCDPEGSLFTKCAPGLKCEGVGKCSDWGCTMTMLCVKAGNFVYSCST